MQLAPAGLLVQVAAGARALWCLHEAPAGGTLVSAEQQTGAHARFKLLRQPQLLHRPQHRAAAAARAGSSKAPRSSMVCGCCWKTSLRPTAPLLPSLHMLMPPLLVALQALVVTLASGASVAAHRRDVLVAARAVLLRRWSAALLLLRVALPSLLRTRDRAVLAGLAVAALANEASLRRRLALMEPLPLEAVAALFPGRRLQPQQLRRTQLAASHLSAQSRGRRRASFRAAPVLGR